MKIGQTKSNTIMIASTSAKYNGAKQDALSSLHNLNLLPENYPGTYFLAIFENLFPVLNICTQQGHFRLYLFGSAPPDVTSVQTMAGLESTPFSS